MVTHLPALYFDRSGPITSLNSTNPTANKKLKIIVKKSGDTAYPMISDSCLRLRASLKDNPFRLVDLMSLRFSEKTPKRNFISSVVSYLFPYLQKPDITTQKPNGFRQTSKFDDQTAGESGGLPVGESGEGECVVGGADDLDHLGLEVAEAVRCQSDGVGVLEGRCCCCGGGTAEK